MVTKLLKRPDGRTLAYSETGDPDGVPVLYFHGIPGSRLDFEQPFGVAALFDLKVRLIGIDRPGFGESTFAPKRTYADWPADAVGVADALGIDWFAILAYSAGGPYAIATALAVPDRLTFVGIVSGVGPAETPNFRKGMGATDAILSRLSVRSPRLARAFLAGARAELRVAPTLFSWQFDRELSRSDTEVHRESRFRQSVRDIFAESLKHGTRGVVEDYRVWARPSGLDYSAVRVPVQIWHGEDDDVVPRHHAEYVARQVPNATLDLLPGVGHLHTSDRWRHFITSAISI